ncbi:hypothetical protein [Thioflavicoccus mobilis]|uniref:hypothetical protein n=1 Tax=Thioflavicoccus mobilis TaxID=80679 RepID=UPI001FDEFAF8|nr:hypothetical protein [Thioflavicoccus mobilis]
MSAIEALGLGVPVIGRVVFAGSAIFPRGLPEGVSRLAELPLDLRRLAIGPQVPAGYRQAWHDLTAVARTDRSTRRRHLALVRQKKPHGLRFGNVAVTVLISLAPVFIALWWLRSMPLALDRLLRDEPEPASPVLFDVLPQPALSALRIGAPDGPTTSAQRQPSAESEAAASPPAGRQAARSVAEITWAEPAVARDAACHEATVSVLYDDSIGNRTRRDRICRIAPSGEPQARD